jgi:hypothetical protein
MDRHMIINCQFLPATILLSFQVYCGHVWIQNQASLPTNSPFCSPESGQPLLLQLVILRMLSGFS